MKHLTRKRKTSKEIEKTKRQRRQKSHRPKIQSKKKQKKCGTCFVCKRKAMGIIGQRSVGKWRSEFNEGVFLMSVDVIILLPNYVFHLLFKYIEFYFIH
jgi:hypothetical protein